MPFYKSSRRLDHALQTLLITRLQERDLQNSIVCWMRSVQSLLWPHSDTLRDLGCPPGEGLTLGQLSRHLSDESNLRLLPLGMHQLLEEGYLSLLH